MKKLITLVFSLGLLTVAFAQEGHRQQDHKSMIVSHNQSWYQGSKINMNDQNHQVTRYSDADDWKYGTNDDRRNEIKDRDDFRRDDLKGRVDNDRFDDRRFSKKMSPAIFRKKSGQVIFDNYYHR